MQLFEIGLIGVGTAVIVGLAGGLLLKFNHHLRSSETTELPAVTEAQPPARVQRL